MAVSDNHKHQLLELSNLNLPLLKQLADALRNLYHSIMVGLLAEAGRGSHRRRRVVCSRRCYYHDIGKSVRPTYFIENQSYMDNGTISYRQRCLRSCWPIMSNRASRSQEAQASAKDYRIILSITARV